MIPFMLRLLADDPNDTRELPPSYAINVGPERHVKAGELPAGSRVGAYVIREVLASGGGGTVYVADPEAPGPAVAIKVLLRDLAASSQALARFQREAEVVKLISHPNIVAAFELGELADGRPYIAMDLEGETLKTLLQRRGRLPPAEVLAIFEPVCSALAAAHGVGVVHRDLKPSNIAVTNAAGEPSIKLLDFGIAKLTQTDPSVPGLTVMGTRLGTPHAMAPEQIRGEAVDHRADIYSLGVLAFQMLTGSPPFDAATAQEIERLHLEAAPARPSQIAPISAAVESVVLRCLAKSPDDRFQSVTALLDALKLAVIRTRESPALVVRSAVAILVELHPGDSDDLVEEALVVLEGVEAALAQAGFELAVQTGETVLAVRLLPDDAEQARRSRADSLELARDLVRRFGEGAGPAPLEVTVSLHAGPAVVLGPEGASRIAGGSLLEPAGWVFVAVRDGVRLTREGAADLGK
jgi:eukaryotic-like serine/threonine-protein kinase